MNDEFHGLKSIVKYISCHNALISFIKIDAFPLNNFGAAIFYWHRVL